MNGAIAEPPASTMRAPKASRMVTTGKSQNFFLFFRKPHTSFKKSIFSSSALVRRFDVAADKHVIADHHHRLLAGFEPPQFQRVGAEKPADDSDWRDHAEKYDREKNFRHDHANQIRQAEPDDGGGPVDLRHRHVHDVQHHGANQKRLTLPHDEED